MLRGELAAELPVPAGDVRLRNREGVVSRCYYDAGTWLERQGERVGAGAFRVGDQVEIVADRKPGAPCFARTLRSGSTYPVWATTRTNRLIERWYPRGNITMAVVVLRWNPELLVVRTRTGEERRVLLREDTRYTDSGIPATLAQMPVNTPLFIRAGRNINQDLEAFQIVWGRLTGP